MDMTASHDFWHIREGEAGGRVGIIWQGDRTAITLCAPNKLERT